MSTKPLSEDTLTELDQFLLSEACDETTLAIDEAHGFLTAMLLAPIAREDEAWLSQIWGEPDFVDAAQRERMVGLMGALIDEIASTLSQRREFEPLVIETEEEEEGATVESYEGWCLGFMLAQEQHPGPWQQLPKNEQGLLAPMAQLALQASDEEPPMGEDEYMQWVELIPGAVMGLYGYWHGG
ncbi:MAG: YecA family protein [Pseudomonadota bacterium]